MLKRLLFCGLAVISFSGCENKATQNDKWHLFGENGVNIKAAWQQSLGSSDVTIAVIDSGFLPDNPAFSQGMCSAKTEYINFIKTNPVLSDNHGAKVSSLIYDCDSNPYGLEGINKYSTVLWLQNGNIGSSAELFQWAAGQEVCSQAKYLQCSFTNNEPADVINASFGNSVQHPLGSTIIRKLSSDAIQYINAHKSILVAAAGNEHMNAGISFPSSLAGVISAGATTKEGLAAGFSNWGETVEIMAPGEDIAVADLSGWSLESGTSFSAPIITAIISLMRAVYPDLNWKSAVYFLQSTAIPMNCNSYCSSNYSFSDRLRCRRDCCVNDQQTCTPGRVDAGAAVAAARNAQENGLAIAVPVALVDSDTYLVSLQKTASTGPLSQGTFTLTNVGGASGAYHLSSPDGKLNFDNTDIMLLPGNTATITVTTTAPFSSTDEAQIRIASPQSGVVNSFSDELVIYAQQSADATL